MSPMSTLMNCGNSSRFEPLKNFPMLVMRGSLKPACKSSAFLFTFMVRSLKQLNVLPL